MKWTVILLSCAWVLWAAFALPLTTEITWMPGNAFTTREACLAELARVQAQPKPKEWGHSTCLPDTIDPRAPKAK